VGDARYDVTFTGSVQGVGFRWTTCRVAQRFDVNGWVRNEPDGTVRCVAEGDRQQLDKFVAAVQSAMAGNIDDTRITPDTPRGDLNNFGIR
jgi:acylphosphatase